MYSNLNKTAYLGIRILAEGLFGRHKYCTAHVQSGQENNQVSNIRKVGQKINEQIGQKDARPARSKIWGQVLTLLTLWEKGKKKRQQYKMIPNEKETWEYDKGLEYHKLIEQTDSAKMKREREDGTRKCNEDWDELKRKRPKIDKAMGWKNRERPDEEGW